MYFSSLLVTREEKSQHIKMADFLSQQRASSFSNVQSVPFTVL